MMRTRASQRGNNPRREERFRLFGSRLELAGIANNAKSWLRSAPFEKKGPTLPRQQMELWNAGTIEDVEIVQPTGLEDTMDTEKKPDDRRPVADQMTDLAARAAGTLAETVVRAVGKRAKKAVQKRAPGK